MATDDERAQAVAWADFMQRLAEGIEASHRENGLELTMARHEALFVGPYAEWCVRDARLYEGDPRWTAVLDGGALEWNVGPGYWPAPVRGGERVEVACAMPRQPRGGCPRWPMTIEWRYGVQQPGGIPCVADWSGLDREAEVAWFADEFAAATEVAGRPPALRWGLVSWVSA